MADSCAYSRVMSELGMGGLLGGGDIDLAGHCSGDEGGATLGEQVTQFRDIGEHGIDLGGFAVDHVDDSMLLLKRWQGYSMLAQTAQIKGRDRTGALQHFYVHHRKSMF